LSGASGRVELKAETASVKVKSKDPSEDLPHQEKNQYWTVYWLEKGALYTKSKEGSGIGSRNSGPLRRGWTWNGGNENTEACLEWLTLHGRKAKLTATCLKGLCSLKGEIYRSVKRGFLSVFYDTLIIEQMMFSYQKNSFLFFKSRWKNNGCNLNC